MRKAAFQIIGEWTEGYWHESPMGLGEMYETRSGKVLVVDKVFDGKFNPGNGESDGYFYAMRPATDAEIDEWNSSSIEEEKEIFEDFSQATEFF